MRDGSSGAKEKENGFVPAPARMAREATAPECAGEVGKRS
jgi:hypothetical protein